MKMNRHTMRCFNDHMGHWMMDEGRFWQLHKLIMDENIVFEAEEVGAAVPEKKSQEELDRELTPITGGGVMIIPIEGAIMRGQSSFGGTSSVQVRRILRNARRDPKVKAIMLKVDSPGGTVAGTDELADEIKATNQVVPIHTHVDGLMASAAFWTASQVNRITATRTSEIGSLGTVAVVHDSSEMAKNQGVKVHVVSTGSHKGAFTPGSEVTEEQLADLQSIVDKLNVFFMEAVMESRGFSAKEAKNLFDGRVHVAQDAIKNGLIDGISIFEDAVRALENEVFTDDSDEMAAMARARATRRV